MFSTSKLKSKRSVAPEVTYDLVVKPSYTFVGNGMLHKDCYGAGDYKLSETLAISKEAAKEFIDAFKNAFPGVEDYIRGTLAEAYNKNYISTFFNRKRRISNIKDKNVIKWLLSQKWEHYDDLISFYNYSKKDLKNARDDYKLCLNTPIQSTASDIMLQAMTIILNKLKEKNLKANLFLNVHDSIVVESHMDDVVEVIQTVIQGMEEDAVPENFPVKLKAECEIGVNYEDVVGVEVPKLSGQELPFTVSLKRDKIKEQFTFETVEDYIVFLLKRSQEEAKDKQVHLSWKNAGGGKLEDLVQFSKHQLERYTKEKERSSVDKFLKKNKKSFISNKDLKEYYAEIGLKKDKA